MMMLRIARDRTQTFFALSSLSLFNDHVAREREMRDERERERRREFTKKKSERERKRRARAD
jgi:hypothetical protein